MALQSFANRFGLRLMPSIDLAATGLTSRTMDAAGESIFGIGKVLLSTGPGTSKVFSSSGAKLYWYFMSGTFADAGTNLRLGIQDVASSVEDGTFDVYADLVGGTDTLTAGIMATAFETGTKTVAHGDLVAFGIEMTARGGADSVVTRSHAASGFLDTYITLDTGSGPARSANALPLFTLVSDDGTVAWLVGTSPAFVDTVTTFGNGSTPDEYALIFQTPVPKTVTALCATLDNVAGTDTFDLVLYSDPLGTPVAERTVTMDPTIVSIVTADGLVTGLLATTFNLAANTPYGVAVLPTSAGTITLSRMAFGSGNGVLRTPTTLGTNWYEGTRSDVTGAFTPNTEVLPQIGLIVSAFDDAASAGGGLLRPVGLGGGLT